MTQRIHKPRDASEAFCFVVFLLSFFGIACYGGCWYVSGLVSPGRADYGFEILNGYELWRTSSRSRSIDSGAGGRIDADVRRLAWDSRYIFAERFGPRIPHNATSPQGKDYLDYWIIDTNEQMIDGPLDKDTFYENATKLTGRASIQLYDTELYGRDGKSRPAASRSDSR